MKKHRPLLALTLLILVWMVAAPHRVSAFSPWSLIGPESFGLGEWQGDLQGGYEWEDQRSTMGDGTTSSLQRNRFDELVNFGNQGFYLIDPRLLTGSAGVNLDFIQEQDKTSAGSSNLDGLLYGYNAAFTLLGEKPISGSVYTNRHQSQVSTDFGGRTEYTNSTLGGTIRVFEGNFLRNMLPYFTSTLDVREEKSNQSTTQLGQTYELNDTRDDVSYDAHKGFETADLGINYEFVKDVIRGSNSLQYQTQHFSLLYSLDFGPRLNRRWDSHVSYVQREGSFSQTYLVVDERLGIDHRPNLSTSYQYQFSHMDIIGQTTDTHFGTFTLSHRLFNNLSTAATVWGSYQTLTGGNITNYGASMSPSYTRSIPWNGTFFLATDTSYNISDNSLQGGNIQVADEQHSAPAVFGIPFTLNNPFVITSSIVMVDGRGGGRIPTQPGVDYNVVPLGNQTQIVILPTTVVIQPNDPLLVSYTYQIPASAKFSTTTWTVNTGVNFGWIGLSYLHLQTRQKLLSGTAFGFLNDTDEDLGTVDLHKEWEALDSRAMASYEIYNSTFISYKLTILNQSLFWRPGWNLILGATGSESFTDFTAPRRKTTSEQFLLSADWFSSSGNDVRLFGRLGRIEDTVIPTETDIEGGVEGRFVYGKIEVVPVFRWINRRWGNLNIDDPHFMLRITRFF